MIRTFFAVIAFVLVAPAFAADEKFKAEDLVGTWKMVKSTNPRSPTSMRVAFAKDGTLVIVVAVGDANQETRGTWKLEGDKLAIVPKGANNAITFAVLALAAETMRLKGIDKDAVGDDEFVKLKAEKK